MMILCISVFVVICFLLRGLFYYMLKDGVGVIRGCLVFVCVYFEVYGFLEYIIYKNEFVRSWWVYSLLVVMFFWINMSGK